MNFRTVVLILAVLGAPAAAWAQSPPAPGCPARGEHLALNGELGEARAAAAKGRLRILAIGSSSIEGVGASRPELGFTPRLEAELERRLPGVEVSVVNRGVGGETTGETVERMGRELEARDYDLVVWQLGTNDVLRALPTAAFLKAFRDGQAILDKAGVEVVLVDPQLLPDRPAGQFRKHLPAVDEVARVIALEGARVRYPVFGRLAAMRAWDGLEGGGVGPDNLHLNDQGYACWAETLAASLAAALR